MAVLRPAARAARLGVDGRCDGWSSQWRARVVHVREPVGRRPPIDRRGVAWRPRHCAGRGTSRACASVRDRRGRAGPRTTGRRSAASRPRRHPAARPCAKACCVAHGMQLTHGAGVDGGAMRARLAAEHIVRAGRRASAASMPVHVQVDALEGGTKLSQPPGVTRNRRTIEERTRNRVPPAFGQGLGPCAQGGRREQPGQQPGAA